VFVENPDGGLDFGYLPEDIARIIRRQPGPIRLLESDLRHIEERHGDQIRQAGYRDVIQFVDASSKSYNAIYRGDRGTLFLVTDNPGTKAKNVIVRLTPMTGKEEDFWAIKTAAIMRRDYFRGRELLLLRDSPYHTQTPEPGVPFSARPRAVNEMLEVQDDYVKDPPLQRDALITRSLQARTSFGAGPEADKSSLTEDHFPVNTPTVEEHKPMEPVFQYGPLSVHQELETNTLEITQTDTGSVATLQPDDPLHRAITKTIAANPHSKGFVANQIHGMLEKEGRWQHPGLDEELLSLGPSQAVERQKPGMEVTEIDLDSLEGKALLAELERQGVRLRDPAEYNREALEIPAVAQETVATLDKVEPILPESERAEAAAIRTQLLDTEEYRPEKYLETGVPEVGQAASEKVQSIVQQVKAPDIADQEKEPEKKQEREAPAQQNIPPKEESKKKFERYPQPVPLFSHKNRPLVLDHGDQITVTRRALMGLGRPARERREQAVATALQAAVERFGQPVHFEGNPAFLKQTAEMAVQMGIKLEPGSSLAADIYAKALREKEQSMAKANSLGPARQPQKQQQLGQGVELE